MTPSRNSRHNIKRIKPPFCGEPFLRDLVSAVERIYTQGWKKEYRIERDKALISALFLTGARPSEIVKMRKTNFDFDNKEAKRNNAFLVKEFALMKHGTKGQRAHVARKFPIWKDDPLVDILIEWHDKADDYLFPNPFKKTKPHLSYFHANGLAKKVGENLPTPHYIFPLWFRRQREFHLAEKRGFTMSNIMVYMGLDKIQETPIKRRDWQNLLVIARDFQQKMLPREFQTNVNPLLEFFPMTNFLDIDINWMLSVIALQLQEIAIQKISEKIGIKLDRTNIEKILGSHIPLPSIKFMPFNKRYTAFSKVVREENEINMPRLVHDMRTTRTNVLHLGYKPTKEETDTILTFTQGFLEKLKKLA